MSVLAYLVILLPLSVLVGVHLPLRVRWWIAPALAISAVLMFFGALDHYNDGDTGNELNLVPAAVLAGAAVSAAGLAAGGALARRLR